MRANALIAEHVARKSNFTPTKTHTRGCKEKKTERMGERAGENANEWKNR